MRALGTELKISFNHRKQLEPASLLPGSQPLPGHEALWLHPAPAGVRAGTGMALPALPLAACTKPSGHAWFCP